MKHFTLFPSILFLIIPALNAQPGSTPASPHVYGAGEALPITVTLSGPDAEKVGTIEVRLRTGEDPPNQPGFRPDLSCQSNRTTGSTFQVNCVIPGIQRSGKYMLMQIIAIARVGDNNVYVVYNGGEDYPAKEYHIENTNHLVKPKITEVK